MRSSRGLQLGTAALAVLLFIAGCGSSAKSGTPASSGSGSNGTASGSTIKIGNIASYTGPLSAGAKGAQDFVNAWAKDVNASGGINGHKVQLVVNDDAGNAATALTAVRDLVQQEKVAAIVGENSYVDATWAKAAEAAGVPVIGGNSLDISMESNADFFPSGTTVVAQFYGVTKIAKRAGPKLAILYCAEAPVCKQADLILKYFTPILGMGEFGQSVSASAPNYTAPCQAVKDFGAQSIVYGQVGPIALRIAQACASQGLKSQIVETAGVPNDDWLKEPAVQGERNVEPLAPPFDQSSAGTKAYNDLLTKYNLTGNAADQYAFAGLQLFAAAVKANKGADVTAASLKAALYSMKGETLGGLVPPLSFKQGKPNSVNCWFESSIGGGKFTTPNGLKTDCAPEDVIATAEAAFKL